MKRLLMLAAIAVNLVMGFCGFCEVCHSQFSGADELIECCESNTYSPARVKQNIQIYKEMGYNLEEARYFAMQIEDCERLKAVACREI